MTLRASGGSPGSASRRQVLSRLGQWAASAALSGGLSLPAVAAAAATGARARLLIVGGGWAGLSALHTLRRHGSALEVTLVDRDRHFRCLPLSSPWLVGRAAPPWAPVDLAAHVAGLGGRFVAASVRGIDRLRRRLDTDEAVLDYDWLLLATGAEYDDSGWTGGDAAAAAQLRQQFPAGFQARELEPLQQALARFEARCPGGTDSAAAAELLLSVPPAPYRCPPAPYERAVLLAGWIRERRLKARVTLLDAGAGLPRFTRLFQDRWPGLIEHRPYSELRRVDPWTRSAGTDEGDFRFDHAMLLPPMGAGKLYAQAGLLGVDGSGTATRWAAVDPLTLRSPHDERIWLAGDALDRVSPLFGQYPKTAQIAADLGAAAARQILAAIGGLDTALPAGDALPSSQCHVWLGADPPEQMRLDAAYRLRGDGVPVQTLRQVDNPQPRGEDRQWLRELLQRRLGLG